MVAIVASAPTQVPTASTQSAENFRVASQPAAIPAPNARNIHTNLDIARDDSCVFGGRLRYTPNGRPWTSDRSRATLFSRPARLTLAGVDEPLTAVAYAGHPGQA